MSTPVGGHPRREVDIHARAWKLEEEKMSKPGRGHPRPGVDVHAQEFFITDCIMQTPFSLISPPYFRYSNWIEGLPWNR